jgi:magnesium-transporting ATPase (P-type)
MQIELFGK